MKSKYKILYLFFCFAIIFTLAGCSQKELPFTNSPENDITIDYMEHIIQNEDKYKEMYMDYAAMRIAGSMSEELEQFLTEMEDESTEKAGKFVDNGDKFIIFQIILEKNKEGIEDAAKSMIDNYLKYSRLGDEEATEFGLSPELEAQDPVGKVKKYMEENNIKITEIVFPETFEQIEYDIYPMKFTYKYIIKGTDDKKPFEKEVIQDFYVGIDWSEGKEKENMKDVIEYIRDVSETHKTEVKPDIKETDKNTVNNNEDTKLFGIPKNTEEYYIKDLSDPENEYFVEKYNGKIFGMEGFLITGKEIKEGEYAEGSGFFIWAQNGAFVIKGINYIDEIYHITLEKVEKGTPQSHEMLHILAQKPFKGQFIKYTDGKDLLNLTLLDKEVGLEMVQGEFQKVDFENNTIDIIPPGSTLVKTYTMVNVPPEMLEGLQKDDVIEYMRGYYTDTVYAVRKVEE